MSLFHTGATQLCRCVYYKELESTGNVCFCDVKAYCFIRVNMTLFCYRNIRPCIRVQAISLTSRELD